MASDQIKFGDFLRALKHHWVTLMGGGVVVVLLGFSERVTGKDVPFWVYGCVVILLVVYASYLAWKDERAKFISADSAWSEERAKFLANQQHRSAPVPEIEIEIVEAILQPITYNSLRCFLQVTVRNLTEDAPCMIHKCALRIRIGEDWYKGASLINADGFQLITCDQLPSPNEIPTNRPFHYEDHLPVIEIARDDITDLRSIIGEEHPLRRGFPKTGWVGFVLKSLPNWPTSEEYAGGKERQLDPETGEEKWVEETTTVRHANTVKEVSLEVIDGHSEHHLATKLPPFGTWDRRISERQVTSSSAI